MLDAFKITSIKKKLNKNKQSISFVNYVVEDD